ncbi:15227_t:CDS:2, partial [Acaulospora morrowiae]
YNEDFDEVMEYYDKQFVPTVVVAEQKTLRTRYVNHSSSIKVLENHSLKKQRFCTDEDDSGRPLSSKDITSIVDSRSEVDSCVKRRLIIDSLKASTKTQEAEDEFIMVASEGNDFPYSKSPLANNVTNKGLEALSEKESDDESVIVVNPCTGEEEYWTPKPVGQPSLSVSRNYSNIVKKRALSYGENRGYASPIVPVSPDKIDPSCSPSNAASQEANFLSSTSSSIQISPDSNSICDSDSTLSCNASPSSDTHCDFPPKKSNILFKTSPWTPDEDKLLIDAVLENLSPPWTHISRNTIQNRSDDSCRHRWARLRKRLYGSA